MSKGEFSEVELAALRADFPILERPMRGGKKLAYLDSCATSQKPRCVWESVEDFYSRSNAAVNRGTHLLADESTTAYEDGKEAVAKLVGAASENLVWTKNSTEAVNVVAYAMSNATAGRGGEAAKRFAVGPGDEICVTRAEHHANLVPWQELCKRTGAKLTWLDLTPEGRIDLGTLDRINERTKLVAFTHASNVTGAVSPVEPISAAARKVGAMVFLDTCQSAAHMPINLRELDVDFAILSAHKMLGPTGIGALYGKAELLADMPPFITGGSIVMDVDMEDTSYQDPPARFEAGTQPVAQIVGWKAACEYLAEVGMDRLERQDKFITEAILEGLRRFDWIRLLGPDNVQDRLGAVAFDIPGIHPHDVGQVLDSEGIAVRVGHHCAIPLHKFFGVRASTRASVGLTTTLDEVEQLMFGLEKVKQFFGV